MSSKTKTTAMKEDAKPALVPKLRFPEFRDGPKWPQHELREKAVILKGKGIAKADLDPNGSQACIRYGELYTRYGETIRDVVSRTKVPTSELFLSETDDVIIPSSGETKIDIATASCVLAAGIALGGDLNVIRSKLNGTFLSYYLNGPKKLDIAKVAQGDTVVHLYPHQLEALYLAVPSPAEQQKIAECLSSVDELIAAQAQKVDALKTHKKGLMQQLFPREGETQPRLRFPEFQNAGEWENKPLSACLDYQQPTPYLVSDTNYSPAFKTPVLTAGKTFILGYTDEEHGIFSEDLPVIIFDDFTTATQFVDFPFKAKSSAMKILQAKNGANIKFMYETLQTLSYEVGAHERHWISNFAPMLVLVPKPAEQQKIAECLSSVDELIIAQARKLDALKTHKKGLMQQLFPSPQEVES
jgi:type I restriction enzyme S subunit